MKKTKILFVMENLNTGGAERVFLNIINNIDRSKFIPKLLLFNNGSSKKASYSPPENTDIIILNKSKKNALKSLIYQIKKNNPDIVFSNLAPINILCGISKILIRNKKTKYVFRETTIRSVSIKKRKDKIFERILYSNLVKVFYRKADKIISLSEGAKSDLITNFNLNKNKIKVIYNPLDIMEIKRLSKETPNDVSFNKDILNIVCVGSLTHSKGHTYLIEALRILKEEKNIKSHLYFIGTGELETDLRKEVNGKKLNNQVFFLGHKNNPYGYIKECDLFILPALWEGFGNVIVEAMASGTPVISTNCESGPKEIIKTEENGLIVQMSNSEAIANAVEKVVQDKVLYSKIKDNGYKRAKYFDIPNIVKKYEDELLDTVKR